MMRLFRRLLVWMAIVGLALGNAYAVPPEPAYAEAPCHGDHDGGRPVKQVSPDACDVCCVGACVAAPAVPICSVGLLAQVRMSPVAYWTASTVLTGRGVPPDPAPPRSIA